MASEIWQVKNGEELHLMIYRYSLRFARRALKEAYKPQWVNRYFLQMMSHDTDEVLPYCYVRRYIVSTYSC